MPSYRFCRPDDIPRLVRAVRECFEVHFPAPPAMTVESYRREMKEVDLWPSSCLLAVDEEGPLGVLTATKREHETLITRVGLRPGRQREGHGSHMVTSLSQKLAVLGPPRLAAEVPAEREDLLAFFTACGYREEGRYTTWSRPGDLAPEPVPDGLVFAVTVAELRDHEALPETDAPDQDATAREETPTVLAWERTRASLEGRAERLSGRAIASPERLEAWLLTLDPAADELVPPPPNPPLEVFALHGAPPAAGAPDLRAVLLRRLAQENPGRALRLPRLAPGEVPDALLRDLGFEPAGVHVRMTAAAVPL